MSNATSLITAPSYLPEAPSGAERVRAAAVDTAVVDIAGLGLPEVDVLRDEVHLEVRPSRAAFRLADECTAIYQIHIS